MPALRRYVPELRSSAPDLRCFALDLRPREDAVRSFDEELPAYVFPCGPSDVDVYFRSPTNHAREVRLSINYGRFARVITRSIEIAAEQDANPVVVAVFKATLEADAKAYLALENAVSDATTVLTKENREAFAALAALDAPYRVARSALTAVLPDTDLPDTLKSLPTDTDQLNAIERLIDLIDDHIDQPWAEALIKGEFGTKAPQAVTEMEEAITANKALAKAQANRAAGYAPTYEKYIKFKRVVRDAYGPGSKQYRRIHLRASPGAALEEENEPPK